MAALIPECALTQVLEMDTFYVRAPSNRRWGPSSATCVWTRRRCSRGRRSGWRRRMGWRGGSWPLEDLCHTLQQRGAILQWKPRGPWSALRGLLPPSHGSTTLIWQPVGHGQPSSGLLPPSHGSPPNMAGATSSVATVGRAASSGLPPSHGSTTLIWQARGPWSALQWIAASSTWQPTLIWKVTSPVATSWATGSLQWTAASFMAAHPIW